MSSLRPIVEAFEPRRLLTFAALDPSFSGDGVETIRGGPPLSPATLGVTALADGGALVKLQNAEFRRFDRTGTPVASYGGGDGRLTLNVTNQPVRNAMAVDPTTGRVALIAANGPNFSHKLNIYSAAGKLEQGIADADLPINLAAIAREDAGEVLQFDGRGGLFVAAVDEGKMIRVDIESGRADASFGTNGAATLPDLPSDARWDRASTRLAVDPDRGLTLLRQYGQPGAPVNAQTVRNEYLQIDRVDAAGRRVATFGTGGTARLYQGYKQSKGDGHHQKLNSLTDVAVAVDGSVLLLQSRRIENSGVPGSRSFTSTDPQVQQVRPDGTFARAVDLTARVPLDENLQRIAVDAAGRAYLVGHRHVIRLDARRRFDEAFNGGTGAATILAASGGAWRAGTFDVAPSGRIFMLAALPTLDGSGDPSFTTHLKLYAYAGAKPGLDVRSAETTRLPDGTLSVAGTTRNDDIRLRPVGKAQVEVSINGVARRFDVSTLTAVLVNAGAGDDNVRVDPRFLQGTDNKGVYIKGGAGDDRLTGIERSDTIDGGSGDDYLDGRGDGDALFGGGGDDTLRGSAGADLLVGDAGADALHANDDAGRADPTSEFSGSGDMLVGGGGPDRFVREAARAGSTSPTRIFDFDVDDDEDAIV